MTNNSPLLSRALQKSRSAGPSADFTASVMERIVRDETAKVRRENRVLMIGAICCGVGLILFAVVLIRIYAGGEFAVSGQTLSQAWGSVSELFRGLEASAVADTGDRTSLWLWAYMALLFLLFFTTGELLRCKRL